jgi:hypothetical protein
VTGHIVQRVERNVREPKDETAGAEPKEAGEEGNVTLQRWPHTATIWGVLLLVGAGVCIGLLDWFSSVEQARSPGEKDFGVAVLGMIFGIPALILAVAGVGLLITGICLWTYRSYFAK